LDDPIFLTAFLHTVVYVVVSVVLEGGLGLMFALLITSIKRGSIVFRTILLLPFLIPPVVNGTMWKLMLNAQFGLLNLINKTLGLPLQSLLSEESTALAGIIMVTVWQWIGYNTLILYAGLQTMPKSVIEAAKMDGASSARILFNVTIPLIKPVLFVVCHLQDDPAFKGF